MKRDMNLVREILLWAEEQDNIGENPSIPEYTEEQVGYHVFIMWQAGLVQAVDTGSSEASNPQAALLSITWSGHDFISAAKSDTFWNKVTNRIVTSGGAFTFELLKEMLTKVAREQLGLQ